MTKQSRSSTSKTPSLVVGIGASAGGIQVLRALLAALPSQSPAAYLVMQHTDPSRMEPLRRLLAEECDLPIGMAKDGASLRAGHVYLIPSDRDCEIDDGRLCLLPASSGPGVRHYIDRTFASLAAQYADTSVGVILSGSGKDGVRGMRAIKAAGGVTIAQDPESAEYRDMPEAVTGANLADLILAPERIAPEIARVLEWNRPARPDATETEPLEPLLRLMQRKTGHDFHQYKEGTVRRRIARRMLVNRCADFDEYRRLLLRSGSEPEALSQDLLISVTGFFRDTGTFDALHGILRPLVEDQDAGGVVRVWVPGCATGEEAYSIAIVLAELLGDRLGRLKIQVFATDIDGQAIREARRATYRPESVQSVSEPLLRRYFEIWDGQYRLRRDLRDMVIFAEHDLIRDPPFTNIDLVSCRNVLIYFKRPLQEQLLANFHYALRPGGLLLLGDSESADRISRLFVRAAEHVKIYHRTDTDSRPPIHLYRPHMRTAAKDDSQLPKALSAEERLRRILAAAYVPACVLVNARQEILYVQGDLSRYVRLPQGEVNANLMDMAATPEIRIELRLVVTKTLRERKRVTSHPVPVPGSESTKQLVMIGVPGEDGCMAVVFEERDAPKKSAGNPGNGGSAHRIAELEKELEATREHLHANIEALEASNEELQSTNEEFQSTTEELQSTVEEYQTTNEELQSTNEELNTVNEELSAKSEALEAANADMQGILDNVAAAIIVLDHNLRVTRYSAASRQIFDLEPEAIGRPFVGIDGAVDPGRLSGDIHEAARTHKQVHSEMILGNRFYEVRIIPRRDRGQWLSGLIVVFTDETERAESQKQAKLLATVIRDANDAVVVRDMEGRILAWNAAATRMFGYREEEVLGRPASMLIPEDPWSPSAARPADLSLAGEEPVFEETCWQTKDGHPVDVAVTTSVLEDDRGRPYAISAIAHDIGARKRAEQDLKAAREAAESANLTKSRFLAAASHDLRQPLQSLSLYLQTAKKDGTGDRQRRDILRKMEISLGAMRHLLNALLNLSKLDTGQVEPEVETVAVQDMIDHLCSQAMAEAESRNLVLRCVPCSAFVRTDPTLLEDVLGNLLFNAIRYTPKGGVLIGCRRRGDRLRIDIVDTGPGIPPEHRDEIFDEFVRLAGARDGERSGLGLGLSIVRRLVDLLGHPLEMDSRVGRGTRFSILVPRAERPAEPRPRRRAPRQEKDEVTGRVLLVDDDEAVRDSTRMFLELQGFSVAAAAGGAEALRLAEAEPPGVAVVDYGLGDEDGFEVVRRLRKRLGTPDLPAVLVTGESRAEIEKTATEAGIRMLLKPVDTDELVRLLRVLLPGS